MFICMHCNLCVNLAVIGPFQAGILSDKLSIALEPEAAALYCRYLPVEKLLGVAKDEEAPKLKTFCPGAEYLIVDLGGRYLGSRPTISIVWFDNKPFVCEQLRES